MIACEILPLRCALSLPISAVCALVQECFFPFLGRMGLTGPGFFPASTLGYLSKLGLALSTCSALLAAELAAFLLA